MTAQPAIPATYAAHMGRALTPEPIPRAPDGRPLETRGARPTAETLAWLGSNVGAWQTVTRFIP